MPSRAYLRTSSGRNPPLPLGTVLALTGLMDGKAPKLLDRVRQAIRLRHYSRRTEEAYVLRTTMTYLHVLERGALGVKSPLDRL